MVKRSKFSKKVIASCLALIFGIAFAAIPVSSSVLAATDPADTQSNICKPGAKPDPQNPCIPSPDDLKSTPDPAAKTCTGGDCSTLITKYINPFIKFLSGLVGVVVAISLVFAGVMYGSAAGDPSKVAAAKKRIYNSIVALLAYLFMFAFLQWLLPGGIV